MQIDTVDEFQNVFPIVVKLDIQWGDMDAFQHLNNVTYFRYFENARIEHFEQTGINAYMQQHQIGPILGHTECKYLKPLTWPDGVYIGTRISALREKRFTMQYAIYSKKLNGLAAMGSGEIVYVDYQKHKTVVIPETIRSAICKLQPELLT